MEPSIRYLLVFISFFIFLCCANEPQNYKEAEAGLTNTSLLDTATKQNSSTKDDPSPVSPQPPTPPPSEEKKKIEQNLSSKSFFKDKGCCADAGKRLEDCCCLAVLEAYKGLVAQKDPKVAQYNMTDPILGKCKKRMVEAFDLIDHPPPPKAAEENYDDLF